MGRTLLILLVAACRHRCGRPGRQQSLCYGTEMSENRCGCCVCIRVFWHDPDMCSLSAHTDDQCAVLIKRASPSFNDFL
eukprot:5495429-Prymnesium_polylepis.1